MRSFDMMKRGLSVSMVTLIMGGMLAACGGEPTATVVAPTATTATSAATATTAMAAPTSTTAMAASTATTAMTGSTPTVSTVMTAHRLLPSPLRPL